MFSLAIMSRHFLKSGGNNVLGEGLTRARRRNHRVFIHITHMTKLAVCLMEVSSLRAIDGNIDRFSKTLSCTELLHFSQATIRFPMRGKASQRKLSHFCMSPLFFL